MLYYHTFKMHVENSLLGIYDSYGLIVEEDNVEIRVIPDLTCDFNSITKLAELCTKEQVEPVHIDDIIENFLAFGV